MTLKETNFEINPRIKTTQKPIVPNSVVSNNFYLITLLIISICSVDCSNLEVANRSYHKYGQSKNICAYYKCVCYNYAP